MEMFKLRDSVVNKYQEISGYGYHKDKGQSLNEIMAPENVR